MKFDADHSREHRLRVRVVALAMVAVAALLAEPLLAQQSSPVAPVIQQR
ncbi:MULTISPECIES: hypothetical protein [Luteococcus]|uniref:Uncharacterized protein n=1 Tax=Luteococcus japonicus LSP_Lj1 TaxID=1255658 RepID=A0A1R4IHR7_9ACTN|nr:MULTISPECIES: hypothetical protein [Luteococcus]MDN5562292.1 hypothetical protein [Luteococcus sp.]SJN19278.1 hypothetical protein FM114_01915 [Luteococcus japonicus LSP_Lj1]